MCYYACYPLVQEVYCVAVSMNSHEACEAGEAQGCLCGSIGSLLQYIIHPLAFTDGDFRPRSFKMANCPCSCTTWEIYIYSGSIPDQVAEKGI